MEFVKAVLGTSAATGTAIVPNNFVVVAGHRARGEQHLPRAVQRRRRRDRRRRRHPVRGRRPSPRPSCRAPTARTRTSATSRFGEATATLYTIAQIADVGNQLLRQSNGAAEAAARRRLSQVHRPPPRRRSSSTARARPSRSASSRRSLAFGDMAALQVPRSPRSRVRRPSVAASRAIEARGIVPTEANLCVVMHPTDFWEMATETLGTSGSGGWAFDPADRRGGQSAAQTVWGVPV